MILAVYGTGDFAAFVWKNIETSSRYSGRVFFIKDDLTGNDQDTNAAVDFDVFRREWMPSADGVLVCAVKLNMQQQMVKKLISAGCRNIYIVDYHVRNGMLPILKDDGSFYSYIKRFEEVKPVLSYIEYHVTDFCNLKCDNCGHHSNETKTLTFESLTVLEEALAGLAKRFSDIDTFRLMGGEPLLAANIHEYAALVLRYFPNCKVKIVTNGLLLTGISEETAEFLQTHSSVEVQVSQYLPTRRHAEEIVAFSREKRIKMSLSAPIKTFFTYSNQSKYSNQPGPSVSNWQKCYVRDCHFLRGHRLFFCVTCWIEEEFFGHDMKDTSFDIVDGNESGWDILNTIENPFPFCAYCPPDYATEKWSAPGQEKL